MRLLTLAAELVDELGLPKKHNVFLILCCFFLYTIIAVRPAV